MPEQSGSTAPARIVPHRNPALLIPDLRGAGRTLGSRLESLRERRDVIVLALVRGGVPVAVEAAKYLRLPLDVVLVRKLLAPHGPISPVCAANVAGKLVLDERLPGYQSKAEAGLQFFIDDAQSALASRTLLCRGDWPPLDIAGKTVLLIDNGARTGVTIQAAVIGTRQLSPAKIIVAIPVGSPESRSLLEGIADELVCLAWYDPFGHVGMWYLKYDVPNVEEVHGLLQEAAVSKSI